MLMSQLWQRTESEDRAILKQNSQFTALSLLLGIYDQRKLMISERIIAINGLRIYQEMVAFWYHQVATKLFPIPLISLSSIVSKNCFVLSSQIHLQQSSSCIYTFCLLINLFWISLEWTLIIWHISFLSISEKVFLQKHFKVCWDV